MSRPLAYTLVLRRMIVGLRCWAPKIQVASLSSGTSDSSPMQSHALRVVRWMIRRWVWSAASG